WTFGPYQSQLHQLSLLLSKPSSSNDGDAIYDIYWIPLHDPMPQGIYHSYEEIRPHIGNTLPPPPDFPLHHIKFLGRPDSEKITAGRLNSLRDIYGFDLLLALLDITQVVPDEPFRMPAVAWVPLHSERVRPTSVDHWSLRHYHAVAALAPSAAAAVERAATKEIPWDVDDGAALQAVREMTGTTRVEWIPHIVERRGLEARAEVGLELLTNRSVVEADSVLTNAPIVERGRERTLEAGHGRSLFGPERKDDFVILLQGGNYEVEDRKGWDTSIQAFVRFYNALEDASRVHLLIHSIESYTSSMDRFNDMDPPAAVLPRGLNLRLALHEWGIPSHAYTIDIARHAPEVVAAYKKRADVCLHPSKVEGFGMNVIECQAVGTPVITTNYTAMGDYTKFGRSVPHRQMIRSPGHLYEMALPDVAGIADAIQQLYVEHLALKRGNETALTHRAIEIKNFNTWIDSTCSPNAVGDKFRKLLNQATLEYQARNRGKQAMLSISPPTSGAYEMAMGYHTPIVDWDAPWTILAADGLKIIDPGALHKICWMHFLNQGGNTVPLVLILPAKYEDGTAVPTHNLGGDIHDHLTVIVRTFMVAGLQGTMTRRKSFVDYAIKNAQAMGSVFGIPDSFDIAIVEGKKDAVSVEAFFAQFSEGHVWRQA
ncbi:hypothetical protein ACHAWX_003235, partial [Stephanocyclus meneghinianus]